MRGSWLQRYPNTFFACWQFCLTLNGLNIMKNRLWKRKIWTIKLLKPLLPSLPPSPSPQNIIEQNRKEQNRIEQNRIEQNRIEQNRIEQNRIEQNNFNFPSTNILTWYDTKVQESITAELLSTNSVQGIPFRQTLKEYTRVLQRQASIY